MYHQICLSRTKAYGIPANHLMNQNKTQHIWLGSHAQISKIDFDSLCLGFPNVCFSPSVRDLGFILDPVLFLPALVSLVSPVLVSATYANFVPSTSHSRF